MVDEGFQHKPTTILSTDVRGYSFSKTDDTNPIAAKPKNLHGMGINSF